MEEGIWFGWFNLFLSRIENVIRKILSGLLLKIFIFISGRLFKVGNLLVYLNIVLE